MYQRDVNEIKAFVKWRGSDALVNTGLFVLLTIQAGLSTVRGSMVKVERDFYQADCLWGKKADGYEYLNENKEFLYGKLYHIVDTKGYDSVEACADVIQLFMAVPNLGMVKAAFLAQCLRLQCGMYRQPQYQAVGLYQPSLVKTPPSGMKPATVRKKVEQYVELTQQEGSEYWWNTWCEYVAGNRANRALDTGDVVSRYHVECVTYGFEHG